MSMKNISSKINQILAIEDSYQAPDRIMDILLNDENERNAVFGKMADLFRYDYSKDWFFEYFQEEHADRHINKQDFTPPCISSIISKVIKIDKKPSIIYEPSAGTGQMIIKDWEITRRKQMPWEYQTIEHIYVCSELSVKTIPFLLFNLSIRGICAVVFHMDTLMNNIFDVYILTNKFNDHLRYSDVTKLVELDS